MIQNRCPRAILRVMSLDGYVDTQQKNFEAIKGSPHYSRLIETIDRLYRATLELGPAHCPRLCFRKMLLMCHKSLLSSATLIARGQPDDAAPVSRRAIEIGHLAIAVHLDSRNYVKWLDEERRNARWQERMKGQRPKSDPGHKWSKDVLEHPLLTQLRTLLGILSDSYAHFTPEFEGNLQWSESHADAKTLNAPKRRSQLSVSAPPACSRRAGGVSPRVRLYSPGQAPTPFPCPK